MGTLNAQAICLAYGDRDLLKDVGFTVSSGSRTALAGGNGSGKSTLLKICAGLLRFDSGNIALSKGLRISYLPQADIVYGCRTVYQEAEVGYDRWLPVLDEIRTIEEKLAIAGSDNAAKALLERHHELQEAILSSSYWQREAVICQILSGLGFSMKDYHRRCNEFSGGWQMRVALAKVLVEDPDIMLLDEPTNYLDIEARIWLRNYLAQFDGGVVIVSHDQDFLDSTVSEVLELFSGKLTKYAGNYSSYLVQREQELQQLQHAWELQQKQRERTEQFIDRFRYKATKARQVQSREKQLEKLSEIEIPSHLRELSFSFPTPPHSPNDMVVVQSLHKRYQDLVVLDNLNLHVAKGDRLAVTGRNGAGKSTLLRILAKVDTVHGGTISWGEGVCMGYYSQDAHDSLDPVKTVYSEIESIAATSDIPKLRSLLGAFLFSDDDIHKQVSILSGGERSRLALLKILLHPANLLILDEPTNHLDIQSKNMLLKALSSYEGTVVFVSHDTHFIKHIANRILYLSADRPELFEGDYEYFSWKLEQKEQVERIRNDYNSIAEQKSRIQPAGQSSGDDQATRRKENNRNRNKLRSMKQQSDNLLEKISRMEKDINQIETEMLDPDNYSDGLKISTLVRRKKITEDQHSVFEEQWFRLHEEIENLEGSDGV